MKFKKEIRALVFGCGSIGERHLFNLKKLGVTDLAVFDINKKKAYEVGSKHKVKYFHDVNSALNFRPTVSLICTYPSSHLKLANRCLDVNSHIFMEKPISHNLVGVEKFLTRAKSRKIKVGIGYNLRFEKGLNFLKNQLKKQEPPLSIACQFGHHVKFWGKNSNYKNHYILKKGSGIILDDSHEYDYLRWLLDDDVKSVYCQANKMTSIKTQTESIASIFLKFKRGTIATIVMDHVRPKYERNCQIISENGDLKWQFNPLPNKMPQYKTKAVSKVTIESLSGLSRNFDFRTETNEMYIREMEGFLYSIVENGKPPVDGTEGLKTLRIGMAALSSSKTEKTVYL